MLCTLPDASVAPALASELPQIEAPSASGCPVCQGRRLHYAFSIGDNPSHRLVRCADCGLMLLNPQPSDDELASLHDEQWCTGPDADSPAWRRVAATKGAAARAYLQVLERYRGEGKGTLLDVGCGQGDLLIEARWMGFQVTGIDLSPLAVEQSRRRLGNEVPPRAPTAGPLAGAVLCGKLEQLDLPPASFDVCVLANVLEHARDPVALLRAARRVLKPGGTILLTTPSLESWTARLLRRNWMEFKAEHLTYFDPNTLQTALFQAGFEQTLIRPERKAITLDSLAKHFTKCAIPVLGHLARCAPRIVPRQLRDAAFAMIPDGMVVLSRSTGPSALSRDHLPPRRLSVIIPAFNEAATVGPLLDAVLRKRLSGIDIEVVVVESNSTDGTRDRVRQYAAHPRVKLVLEDRPRGKGHAVRAGLAQATGDFVLIQDADLEYDLEDYDVLLEPLASGREALVLGARHGGNAWWKMRQFNQQRLMSLFFNCGHWIFTSLLNVLFGQKLKDPFTMFKVFRRDCLHGLDFKCNRFDFDYELLIKLIRKGYRPVEIPVNYRSRSFKEGKKVSAFRDPLSWLAALAWLRVTRIDPLATLERQRAARTSESQQPTVLREAA